MNEKEKFCRSFDWRKHIRWFDLTGYVMLDSERMAKIALDAGKKDSLDGFDVYIISKHSGVVDSKTFLFKDYLDYSQRADNHPNCTEVNGFSVYPSCGYRWYTGVPKTTRPLCEAIERWIALFE